MRGAVRAWSAAPCCNCSVARLWCAAAAVRHTASACAGRVAACERRDWRSRSADGACNCAISALRSTAAGCTHADWRYTHPDWRCTHADWGCSHTDRPMRSRDFHTRFTAWRSSLTARRACCRVGRGARTGLAPLPKGPQHRSGEPRLGYTGRLPVTSAPPEGDGNSMRRVHLAVAPTHHSDKPTSGFPWYAHSWLESVYMGRHSLTCRA